MRLGLASSGHVAPWLFGRVDPTGAMPTESRGEVPTLREFVGSYYHKKGWTLAGQTTNMLLGSFRRSILSPEDTDMCTDTKLRCNLPLTIDGINFLEKC